MSLREVIEALAVWSGEQAADVQQSIEDGAIAEWLVHYAPARKPCPVCLGHGEIIDVEEMRPNFCSACSGSGVDDGSAPAAFDFRAHPAGEPAPTVLAAVAANWPPPESNRVGDWHPDDIALWDGMRKWRSLDERASALLRQRQRRMARDIIATLSTVPIGTPATAPAVAPESLTAGELRVVHIGRTVRFEYRSRTVTAKIEDLDADVIVWFEPEHDYVSFPPDAPVTLLPVPESGDTDA